MYIYIKPEAVEELKKYLEGLDQVKIAIEYGTESGRNLISTHQNPFGITFSMVDIPEEFIEEITIQDHQIDNENCTRIEGIYRHEGAVLQCHLQIILTNNGMNECARDIMVISITAPNLKSLQTIYTQFRLGKIEPEENWEVDQVGQESPSDEDKTE
ncbi:MAG: hypothetical protein ACNFW9_03390 [Candidatus Kerfeldbacteria bacterium]